MTSPSGTNTEYYRNKAVKRRPQKHQFCALAGNKYHPWKDLVKAPCTWWQMNLMFVDQPPLRPSLRLFDHVLDSQESWEVLQTRTGWMNVRGTHRWAEQPCKTPSLEKACWDPQDTESAYPPWAKLSEGTGGVFKCWLFLLLIAFQIDWDQLALQI